MTSAPTDPSKGKLLTKERFEEIHGNYYRTHAIGDSRGPFKAIGELLQHIAAQAALLDQAERALRQIKDASLPLTKVHTLATEALKASPDEEGK